MLIKKRQLAASVAAVIISLIAFSFSLNAQNNNSSNASQTPAVSPTPKASPTPISLGNVVTEAEAAAKKLEEIRTDLSENPSIAVIQEELPKLSEELDLRTAETNQTLTAQPSLETLRKVEQDWRSLSSNIPAWKKDLSTSAAVLDSQLAQLGEFAAIWQLTLDTAGGTSVPPEILERIGATISSINQTRVQVQEKRAQLLSLQNRISDVDAQINTTLETVRQAREEALSHLFVKDSPAVWNLSGGVNSTDGLIRETTSSFTAQAVVLSDYFNRQSERFILHAIVLLLLTGGLYWARRGVRPKVIEEPKLKQAAVVFEYPFATALLLTILFSGWLYPQSPRILTAMLGAAALVPGVIILRCLIEESLFSILNALMVFYFIDRLREITASLPVVSRILFLAEMMGAIIFLIWVLRSKRLSSKIEVKHQRIFTLIKKAIPFTLGIFAIAFLANIFGFVSLARVIGNGVLGSIYAGLVLYAAIKIVESLLVFAVRVRPLSQLGIVRSQRRAFQDKILRVLRFAAVVAWIVLTLNLLSISELIFTFVKDFLTAELVVGWLRISLGDVLAFGFTVWLAFLLSRFVRFVLQEDVYPRVNLAGGIPYAISTIAHYVILLIGFFFAIAALGVDLTKFSILAGAFGVGLGFGLQNIVNNFVSGLILLFERPVKVGDTVQIGEYQGDLKRIGLRASVLRTLQGSEVIVPNGHLISDEVVNWTFSDNQRRLEINVGVAYGNDPAEVIELLTKAVSNHPEVLKEPPPSCLFLGFGENSLDFQARAWTNRTSQWVVVQSDLAVAINKALSDAGIEIPFPQRDLNVRILDKNGLKNLQRD